MSSFLKVFFALLILVVISVALFYYMKDDKSISQNENDVSVVPEVDLRSKIGQMILLGFRGTTVTKDLPISTMIKDLQIGGIILFDYDVPSQSFPRNITGPAQVKQLIADLQSYSATPLFVSVDAEGGNVNRLKEKYGFANILSAKDMGKDATLKTTERESVALAQELKELGFNMNFAPVVDVDINPGNPVIGALGRSFSLNPKTVTDHAKVFIENHLANNIIPVAKHFPGHGSSTRDSHLGLVDITQTYKNEELLPYKILQKEGLLDVVMTAHIMNKNIDKNNPATLSPLFIKNILREEIGFGGVVISDDMQMNAIVDHYGFKEAVIGAVNAGCDILLLSNNGTAKYDEELASKAIDIIYNTVQDGTILEKTIEDSYNRIIHLKEKFGIL